MSQELITYIVLGSNKRLKGLKLPNSSKNEEYILANLSEKKSFEETLDQIIFDAKGNIIVLLPPSSFPNSKSKEILQKISMIDQSSWGWFRFNDKKLRYKLIIKVERLVLELLKLSLIPSTCKKVII